MTVGELRDVLRDLPGDMLVGVEGYEGGYSIATAAETYETKDGGTRASYYGRYELSDSFEGREWPDGPRMLLILAATW